MQRSNERRYRRAAEPLSRAQQIEEALTLLDPPPKELNEWQQWVEHALDVVDLRSRLVRSLKGPISKQGKLEVRRYRNALLRVRAAHRGFDPAVRPWFSLLAADTQEAVIEREIARADSLLRLPARPSGGKDASRAKAAVALAHSLLVHRFGLERVTTTRPPRQPSDEHDRRGEAWARLSAVLLGDRKADLYEHMRAQMRTQTETRPQIVPV